MAAVDDDGFGEPTDDGWGDADGDWGQSPESDSQASEGVFKVHVAQEVKKQLQDDQDFLTYTKMYACFGFNTSGTFILVYVFTFDRPPCDAGIRPDGTGPRLTASHVITGDGKINIKVQIHFDLLGLLW
jgi:hypothetical protein